MTAFEPTWDADRNDPSTWKRVDRGALKAASEHGAFAAYASPIVVELVDSLLGAGRWDRPRRWGLPMGTLPTLGSRCAVPSTGWHLDGSPRVGPADPLVRTFALLASHDHGAGSTLVVAGRTRAVDHVLPRGDGAYGVDAARRSVAAKPSRDERGTVDR